MGILNPFAGNYSVAQGAIQLVYTCPSNKSHALVDLSFFKDNVSDATIQVALSTAASGSLTSVDYFLDDIVLLGVNKTAELTKVIVGKNENLYVKLLSGTSNVRASGVEELNSKVGLAGRLSASNIPVANTQTKIYECVTAGAAYVSTSVTLFNSSLTTNATIQFWVTAGAGAPGGNDKLMEATVIPNDTVVIENLITLPGEKLWVRSDQANTEYFVNGVVVLS
jgi:hypothetical protein